MLEVHLMIVQPERYFEEFARAGGDLLIFHQEAVIHLDSAIRQVKRLGKKVGIALNPATPVHELDHILQELDSVLVMTVNPGWGGQDFIEYTLRKIQQIREMIDARNLRCDVEVDGGIELHTIRRAYEAGANLFVAGTSVFDNPGGPRVGVASLIQAAQGDK
jgi:ribulose-phosphate 3-epimerase